VDDVNFSYLSSEDVVRHRLVGRIVDAYAQYDAEREQARGPVRGSGRRDDARRGSR
jgi:phosphate starvation-inducible PhoH-like protein